MGSPLLNNISIREPMVQCTRNSILLTLQYGWHCTLSLALLRCSTGPPTFRNTTACTSLLTECRPSVSCRSSSKATTNEKASDSNDCCAHPTDGELNRKRKWWRDELETQNQPRSTPCTELDGMWPLGLGNGLFFRTGSATPCVKGMVPRKDPAV